MKRMLVYLRKISAGMGVIGLIMTSGLTVDNDPLYVLIYLAVCTGLCYFGKVFSFQRPARHLIK